MNPRTGVLLWAQRVLARKGQPSHVLLEVSEDATADQVQAAFHQIARTSHPDLHRRGLDAAELELVTSAYATVAGAYQELRMKTKATVRMVPLRREDGLPATPPGGLPVTPPAGSSRAASGTPPSGAAATSPARAPRAASPSTPPPVASATPPQGPAMSPKAVIYYRKAELCLRRGDLKGAVLQLKLAIAQDPTSSFLRTALAEVETEVRKTT